MSKQFDISKVKVKNIRADGTIVASMAGVIIPLGNGYYPAVACVIERIIRERKNKQEGYI
jgi:hypothetical protein